MPPRRKSRRTAGPADDTVDVQFVPDPVEISPQAAVEASTSFGAGSEGLSDAMVSSIVAAVKTAIQSTNAAQNSSSPTNLVAAAVQHNVSSITNTPVETVESSGSEIFPSAPLFSSIGVPLGSRLSARLKNKIWAEEFVSFGSLLDTSPNLDKFALSITPPTAGNGSQTPNFTFEPVNNAKKLTSIYEWVSAFHTFVAVYCEKFPRETPNLMQFCETVRDIAARGGDWNYYDEQFRYLRQGNPPKYPWGVMHWELWHRAMTFRAKSRYFATDKPGSGFRGKQPMVRGVCFTFNAGRPCAGCRYAHNCSKCGGRHAATSCQSAPNIPKPAGDGAFAAPSHNRQLASDAGRSIHPWPPFAAVWPSSCAVFDWWFFVWVSRWVCR
ncbi:uncharacterized protein LOC122947575 [Acropora millepora]|uniref:uncharacterized protein LOC122947575 n=1 Tax=Acropora millepora TaxID=45264 RepID=UPI001CF250F1|nr:uncharacterized protein LOC122947575 [Acropora millepora]